MMAMAGAMNTMTVWAPLAKSQQSQSLNHQRKSQRKKKRSRNRRRRRLRSLVDPRLLSPPDWPTKTPLLSRRTRKCHRKRHLHLDLLIRYLQTTDLCPSRRAQLRQGSRRWRQGNPRRQNDSRLSQEDRFLLIRLCLALQNLKQSPN